MKTIILRTAAILAALSWGCRDGGQILVHFSFDKDGNTTAGVQVTEKGSAAKATAPADSLRNAAAKNGSRE